MESSMDEVEELHENSLHGQQPTHQLNKQPSFGAVSSPRPSRSQSNSSLARSFKDHSAKPTQKEPVDLKALDNSGDLLLPSATSRQLPKTIYIENNWPPAPYGVENLPQYSFRKHDSPLLQNQSSSLSNPSTISKKKLNNSGTDSKVTTTNTAPINYNNYDFDSLLSSSNQNIDLRQVVGSAGGEQEKYENLNLGTPNRIVHPPSITLTLFENWNNPNISWRTKFKSFSATLFINLFLPFMNGVMLGFGEIAAKEIIGGFFGWGPSAHRYRKHDHQIDHPLSATLKRSPSSISNSGSSPNSNSSSENSSHFSS